MAPDRRTFLKLAVAQALLPAAPRLLSAHCDARALIRGGGVGRVVFCRASRTTARWLNFVLDGAAPVCERIDSEELVLCGTEATLVIDRAGYRRFA
jgi:hypothetical protein